MILLNGPTAQKFPRPLLAMGLLPGIVTNLDIRSRPRCVITGGLVDFLRSHLAGDISHLLADVVSACIKSKSLELSFDVDGRLTIEPRRAELDTILVMARSAGRYVAHRRAAGDDMRRIDGRIGVCPGLTRQI